MHSFRIWLACALLAAGATPEQIMLLLRWSSEAARKLYAMMGQLSQAALLGRACEVKVDAVRAHTLLVAATTGATGLTDETTTSAAGSEVSAAQREAAAAVAEAKELLQRAAEWHGDLPAASALPCPIDDDEAHARVQDALEELRRSAAKADEALKLGDADGDSDEDGEDV